MTHNFRNMLLTFAAIGAIFTFPGCSPRQSRIRAVEKKITQYEKKWHKKAADLKEVNISCQRNFVSASGTCFLDRNNQYILKPFKYETRSEYEERLQFLSNVSADFDEGKPNASKICSILTLNALKTYIAIQEKRTEMDNDGRMIEAMMQAIRNGNYDKIEPPEKLCYNPDGDEVVIWALSIMTGNPVKNRNSNEEEEGNEKGNNDGKGKGNSNKNSKVQPGIGPFCGDRDIDTHF